MAKTSLTDIANKLGVSKTLISLVLNGHAKENRISDDMVEKVLTVAEEMNYKPNYLAKGLRTGKTNTIGLVVSDISNPMFAQLGRHIEDEAEKNGYNVFFTSSDESHKRTRTLITKLIDRQVDGLLVVPCEENKNDIQQLHKQGFPVVLLDRDFPRLKTNFVGIDNYTASLQAVNHLFDVGYSKIGMISFDWQLDNYKMRLEGYKAACKNHNVRLNNSWQKFVNYNNMAEETHKAVAELMLNSNPPRALFLANNNISYHVLEALQELKIRIPQDVALVSFDNDPAFAFTYSPLSVVNQPIKDIAKTAVQTLLHQINNTESETKKTLLSARLDIRHSCGAKSYENR